MSDFMDFGVPVVGGMIGREKLRHKRRKVVMEHMFEGDGSRRRPEDDDGEEIDLQDPDAPGYRSAVKGERPTPRAQWDDARGCWIEWSKQAGDWVVVGDAPA